MSPSLRGARHALAATARRLVAWPVPPAAARDGDVLPPGTAGRIAGVLYLGAGLVTALSPLLPAPPGLDRVAVTIIGLVAMATGVVVWLLPWPRWRPQATLWLVPLALLLIALHNYYGGADPYRYSVFFMIAFTWIGLAHSPGTSVRFVPLLVVAYFVPLIVSGAYTPSSASSALYVIPVCVLVSETVAWVTERLRQTHRALGRSEARFRSLIQNADEAITVIDARGRITYESPAVTRVTGRDPEAMVGEHAFANVHPDDLQRAQAAFATILRQPRGTIRMEVRVRHRDGSWRWVEATGTNLLDDPSVEGIVVNARDVTVRKALEDRLTHDALHDPLTGLPNRALFLDRVRHALGRAARHPTPVSVLFLDLDEFKAVNDSFGHLVGDDLLVAVAERLTAAVRPGDTAARLGGDEFAILVEDAASRQTVERVATRILDALEAPFVVQGRQLFVRGSIGVAGGDHGRANPDELLRDADVAMYAAKAAGKGRYAVFHPDMHLAIVRRLELEADLRTAVSGDELTLEYHPIVDLATGRLVGAEALLRWPHATRGAIAPREFIPVAEETGLVHAIGRRVLEAACRQSVMWRAAAGAQPFSVSVNVSPRQLQHDDFVRDVAAILRATGASPEDVILELTESVLIQEGGDAVARLHALRALGVRVAIDDFGIGYSSLGYLRRFPVSIIKIDRSFVAEVDTQSEAEALVAGMIELGHSLSLQVVAEGVETGAQHARLRRLGCDFGQGYYFGPPVPAERVTALRQGTGAITAPPG